MAPADHAIKFKGFAYNAPMFELICLHHKDDIQWCTDDEGKVWDECLIQEWWTASQLDELVDHLADLDNQGRALVWVRFLWPDGPPTFMNREQYEMEFE